MSEMKSFRVIFYGPAETRKRVGNKLDKYFKDRCLSDQKLESGTREVELRNRTKILCRELLVNGAFREPFLEMNVTATDEYLARSVKAVRSYAVKANLAFDLSIESVKEAHSPSRRPSQQSL
jgi:hypothetical protein